MEILKVEIVTIEHGHWPYIRVYVDKQPKIADLRFQEAILGEGGLSTSLFWAEKDGYVFFMTDGSGGGYNYDLTLVDGTTKQIRGGWSSRPGVMNAFFPHTIDCTFYERDGNYKNLGYAGAILISTLEPLLDPTKYAIGIADSKDLATHYEVKILGGQS